MKITFILSLLFFMVGCNSTKKECTEFIPEANQRYAKYCEQQAMFDVEWNDTWDKSKSPNSNKRVITNADGEIEIVDSWRLPEVR